MELVGGFGTLADLLRSTIVLWISQNIEDEYSYRL